MCNPAFYFVSGASFVIGLFLLLARKCCWGFCCKIIRCKDSQHLINRSSVLRSSRMRSFCVVSPWLITRSIHSIYFSIWLQITWCVWTDFDELMWKRHACLVRSAIWSRSTSSGEPNDEDLPEQCSLQLLTCREKLKRPSSVWRRSGWKSRSLMMPSAIACACLHRFKEWKVSIIQIRFVADCLSSAGSHGLSKCCGDWKRCVIRRDRMLICECASMGLRLRLRCGRVAHDSSIIRCFKGTRFAMLSVLVRWQAQMHRMHEAKAEQKHCRDWAKQVRKHCKSDSLRSKQRYQGMSRRASEASDAGLLVRVCDFPLEVRAVVLALYLQNKVGHVFYHSKTPAMLYLIAVILLIGWALGFFVFSVGSLIHILLVIAIIAILLRLIRGGSPVWRS